jgi:hypothetical protein
MNDSRYPARLCRSLVSRCCKFCNQWCVSHALPGYLSLANLIYHCRTRFRPPFQRFRAADPRGIWRQRHHKSVSPTCLPRAGTSHLLSSWREIEWHHPGQHGFPAAGGGLVGRTAAASVASETEMAASTAQQVPAMLCHMRGCLLMLATLTAIYAPYLATHMWHGACLSVCPCVAMCPCS